MARLIGFGFSPIGLAITGILLQMSGPQVTVILLVVVQVILAGVATVNGAIRRMGELEKV